MEKQLKSAQRSTWLEQIMFDPLSYIHPRRLRFPHSLDTPRQRAIVNRMLLGDLPYSLQRMAPPQDRLLQHWRSLPYVCSLVGAQLLKPDLAWRGRSLRLPVSVQFFMALPLQQMITSTEDAAILSGGSADADPLNHVQSVGLSRILEWQQQAPIALLGRMRLLFPPELDTCFEGSRRPLQANELFLISQAIQYAKNHPHHV